NGCALVALLIEGKVRFQRPGGTILAVPALVLIAHLVEQIGAEAGSVDGLEKLLGDNHIGVDIGQVDGGNKAFVGIKWSHVSIPSRWPQDRVRTSVMRPVTAAATAIAGLIRW